MNLPRLNLIASLPKILFTSLLIVSFLPVGFKGTFLVPAEASTLAEKDPVFTEIDRAITNGAMEKAISLLDSQLVQVKKDKDAFLEAKLLSQLQFAHYCKGGLRRSLLVGQDLSDVIQSITKRGISDPRIGSTIADNTTLYTHILHQYINTIFRSRLISVLAPERSVALAYSLFL